LLKREVRILGLSAPSWRRKKTPVIGVVFRGSLWLDGVFTCLLEPHRSNHLSTLVRAITRSKQYSQIRAVILSREQLVPGAHIEITKLAQRINLPVISIIRKPHSRNVRKLQSGRHSKTSGATRYEIKTRGKPVSVWAAGISHERTCEIFAIGCAVPHRVPEAVRVADLIAKHVSSPIFFAGPSNA
jgi:endonuclease V-like protein UPF0215 family